jgi:hypothetical protein
MMNLFIKKEHKKMKRVLVLLPLFLALFLVLGTSGNVKAGERNKQSGLAKTAIKGDYVVFDINNISTYIRNNGSFNRDPGTGNAGFKWPKTGSFTAIYASGIWMGAKELNTVRCAIAEYSYEYSAGPVGANQNDPQWKVYKIKKGDNALTNSDYANWISAGGPALRNYNNTADSLDASGNQIPLLIGDGMVFAIFNDADTTSHKTLHTLPIGVEVQLTAWAFNRSDALGNSIFYNWKIINKSGNRLDSTYVCVWCDADVGSNGTVDYDGCDTTLGLGYTYNGAQSDYPNGAAVGFDFLQGPIVPGALTDTAKLPNGSRYPGKKILQMTSYMRYTNGTSDWGDPQTGQEAYNYFQGYNRVGVAPVGANGLPAKFMFPGDPNLANSATNWVETDPPGDRRFMMSAGPFTMLAGDTQVVVAGNLAATSNSRPACVTALKIADKMVQTAYDLNFNLASPPPAPTVEVSPLNDGVVLTWGKDETKIALDEAYHQKDPIAAIDTTDTYPYYDFQGYVVYQFDNAQGTNAKIVKTYDIVDSVDVIYDNIFSNAYGSYVNAPVKYGSNNGISRSIKITSDAFNGGTKLVNNKDYYFAVTAYGYNPNKKSIPLTTESPFNIITVRPRLTNMGNSFQAAGLDTIGVANPDASARKTAAHTAGISNGFVIPVVIQPDSLTGDVYKVKFDNLGSGVFHYTVVDTTRGDTVLRNGLNFTDNELFPIKDGIFWKVVDAPVSLKSVTVTGTQWVDGGGTYGSGYGFADFDGGVAMSCSPNMPNVVGWGPTLPFSSFKKVELRIDTNNQGWAYRYRRYAAAGGPSGYRFVYQNMVKIPVQAWDVTDAAHPRRLNVAFRDQVVDGVWNPWGNYTELLCICASTYDSTGATYSSNTTGGPYESDAMYALELAVLSGHTAYESPNTITITPYYVLTSADVYTVNSADYKATPGKVDVAKSQIDRILAVPNPYFGADAYETNQFGHVIRFTNLPASATIRIFTLAGQLVRTYVKNDPSTPNLDWNVRNESGLPVASGMYIVHIDLGAIGTKILKIAVIQAEERLNNF